MQYKGAPSCVAARTRSRRGENVENEMLAILTSLRYEMQGRPARAPGQQAPCATDGGPRLELDTRGVAAAAAPRVGLNTIMSHPPRRGH